MSAAFVDISVVAAAVIRPVICAIITEHGPAGITVIVIVVVIIAVFMVLLLSPPLVM